MPIAIQELRPDGVVDAVQFAAGCGCETKVGKLVPSLSLLAVDEDTTLAAALCFAQPGRRHRVEVAVKDAADAKLHRALVDKTLMKLASRDVRKFDIRTNGADEPHDFWRAVSWIDLALGSAPGAEDAKTQAIPEDKGKVAAPAAEAKNAAAEAPKAA